jgi:hypothetical protein
MEMEWERKFMELNSSESTARERLEEVLFPI